MELYACYLLKPFVRVNPYKQGSAQHLQIWVCVDLQDALPMAMTVCLPGAVNV